MKKSILAAAGLTLLLGATPLAARPRYSEVCRVVHPAYYYQSFGRRPHLNYRRDHYVRFHARFTNGATPYYYYRAPDYRYRYRDYRYRDYRYRGGRYVQPYRRNRLRRPRIGVYLEF